MTALGMNAPDLKKIEARAGRLSVLALAMLAAPLGLSVGGCAGASTGVLAPLDPDARTLVDAHRRYPRWADFPATSSDLPAPADIAGRVRALGDTAETLAAETARIEWTLRDPAGFSADVSSRVSLAAPSALTAQTQAEVEAFAAALRARAEAPPPIDRRR